MRQRSLDDGGLIPQTLALPLCGTIFGEAEAAPLPAALPEFVEDGRLYVFRYAAAIPQHYRDRIFDYIKRRRLPDQGQRQIRRDVRNRAELWDI